MKWEELSEILISGFNDHLNSSEKDDLLSNYNIDKEELINILNGDTYNLRN
jgi:DNA-directed RNA polymerase subunit H (RpoH/RPB5)